MTKLAALIADQEGFHVLGSIPNRQNNPGDLRHSPHSHHPPGKPDDIGTIDTNAHGWDDLERQLRMYASRGLTIEQAIHAFAPPSENNTEQYIAYVCAGLGVHPQTLVSNVLNITV